MFYFFKIVLLTFLCLKFFCQPSLFSELETCEKDPDSENCEIDAIASLHSTLDNDKDGQVNDLESQKYLSKYIKNQNDLNRKKDDFHRFDTDVEDGNVFVSVKELQEAWKASHVRSWTEEEVADWLIKKVKMPEYVSLFKDRGISGRDLPMLALKKGAMLKQIGIKNDEDALIIANLATLEVLFPSKSKIEYRDVFIYGGLMFIFLAAFSFYFLKVSSKEMDLELREMKQQLKKAEDQLSNFFQFVESTDEKKLKSNEFNIGPLNVKKKSIDENNSSDDNDEKLKRRENLVSNIQRRMKEFQEKFSPILMKTKELEMEHSRERLEKAKQAKVIAFKELNKVEKDRKTILGNFRTAYGLTLTNLMKVVGKAVEKLNDAERQHEEMIRRWNQIDEIFLTHFGENGFLISIDGKNGISESTRLKFTNEFEEDECIKHSRSEGSFLTVESLNNNEKEEDESLIPKNEEHINALNEKISCEKRDKKTFIGLNSLRLRTKNFLKSDHEKEGQSQVQKKEKALETSSSFQGLISLKPKGWQISSKFASKNIRKAVTTPDSDSKD